MDIPAPAAPPNSRNHRQSPSADRFLGLYSRAPPPIPNIEDDLNEDDLFWSPNSGAESPSAALVTRIRSFPAPPPEGFGLLAALPDDKSSLSSSSSSSPSSASRLIPVAPRAPQDRIAPLSSLKYHQSAPLNVPVLSHAMRRPLDFFDEVDDTDADADADSEMLPPHEMVARTLADSPLLSSSVLEGAGRTLKGRDLRQVRNAVFRHTGFLD